MVPRQISEKITSTISTAWSLTTKSDGIWFFPGDPPMRTLKLHFPDEALPTLDSYLKQTKEARVFRRAQAVREVVKGQRFQTVSDALHFTYSALRKWVHRFAHQGIQGLVH